MRDCAGRIYPAGLVANLPADPAAICGKAIQKHPGLRYQTTLEFAEDLRRWLRTEPTRARPAWALRRTWLWAQRNKGWAMAIGVVLFASFVLLGGGVRYQKNKATAFEAKSEAAGAKAALAEAQAFAEGARADLAEQVAQTRKRELLMQQLQRLRLSTHQAGWSEDAWERVRGIANIRKDDDLRNEAAHSLSGLDAQNTKTFEAMEPSFRFARAS